MFCSKCGSEIMDEAVICPNCGCSTENFHQKKDDKVSAIVVLLTIIVPLVGFIMGIIYLGQGKRAGGTLIALSILMCLLYYFVWGILLPSLA